MSKILKDVSLKKYTTYKLEEKAKEIIFPETKEELISILKELKGQKYMIIGNGSNLIFKNNYDGILINLKEINDLKIEDNIVKVDAGYNLIKLSRITANLGLSGLEFASGIPGTVGGSVYMNAGAYKSDMSNVIESIRVLDENLNIKEIKNKDLNFSYRHSLLQEKNYICLDVTLKLVHKNKEEILDLIKDRKRRRLESQPLDKPTAGSVFRNPEGDFAGRLIEELGFKGKHIGGAYVSEKHANFIYSDHAKGEDIIKLIKYIQTEVYKKYKIKLKCEQKIIE